MMERMTIQQLLEIQIHQESQVFAVSLVLVKDLSQNLKNASYFWSSSVTMKHTVLFGV